MKKGLVSWAGEWWMDEEGREAGSTEQEVCDEGMRGQGREWRGESIIPDGTEFWKVYFSHESSLFYMRNFPGKRGL